ncbi:MAG: hypothetical protein QOI79_635, partial [Mycobacterium sp.]|nr:hypothetical protein [Mycobacterium sp.]MDT5141303.1 hypothetical protein [Mycobacterium sp.]
MSVLSMPRLADPLTRLFATVVG